MARRREQRALRHAALWVALLCFVGVACSDGVAATLVEAQQRFRQGDYAGSLAACDEGVAQNRWLEEWWLLKIRNETETGQYESALRTFAAARALHGQSLSLRVIGAEVLRCNGRDEEARSLLKSVEDVAEQSPRRLEDAASRVAAGQAKLAGGADARVVLEQYFDAAKKSDPSSELPLLAEGEVGLAKSDYALAAEAYTDAVKLAPDDPDAQLGLARAYAESDSDQATAALTKALSLNPKHLGSLLFQADQLIDREAYAAADELLRRASATNARDPRIWAYWAVLAHLAGDRGKEAECRRTALALWPANPAVDHLIGQKLSQKYRFAEGERYQRQALALDPHYEPANVQLCQDLLRLGRDDEGWQRATDAQAKDPYNVVTYNLVTLHDVLAGYRTVSNDHFRLRMLPTEADIYGDAALKLLERARQKLSADYRIEMADPIAVEIFPKQSDFAIRTFGLPGGAGYLGVCFGPVITVNSPASRMGRPSNWQAVMWHEFCHSVTLRKTLNKMPRWLSEGISVYEEKKENSGWGQAMNPAYRELILSGGPTPVSGLSGAFLKPPTPMHLQFAYFESSMVIQYVVHHFGPEALQHVLDELAEDVPINTALAKHTEPIDALDRHFAEWLKQSAEKLGDAKTDWKQPDVPLDADSAAMRQWNTAHPHSFFGLLGEGRALLAEEKFKASLEPLEAAAALYPTCGQAGGPYLLLAAAHRGLQQIDKEREMLARHVSLDGDSIEPRLRLAEIDQSRGDWAGVRQWAEQVLAINPLIPAPHQWLAKVADATSDRSLAVEAHLTLLKLDPVNAAEHHFQLAKLMVEMKQWPTARNHVLRALEDAPRFRAAYDLLEQIAAQTPTGASATQPATH